VYHGTATPLSTGRSTCQGNGRTRSPEGGACAERCRLCDEAQDRASNDRARIAAKAPFSFVAADSMYGVGEIETLLRKAGKGYVLGVASNHVFRSWGKEQLISGTAAAIAQSLPKKAWRRLTSGEGTKGPRWRDWAYLELADLDASEYNDGLAGQWTRGLLIRRNSPTAIWPSSPPGAPRARRCRSWCP
jgi:SRSO17 transposase